MFIRSENEEKYWGIRNKISENIKEINNLIDEHIKDLEDTVSQKSAYDDEEYYSLQERIETLKELKSTHNIYYLKQESELVGEDEVMQSIVEKNKERNILNSKEDNIVSLLREGFEEKELFYMVRSCNLSNSKKWKSKKNY
jgi:hypothetical protein